MKRIAIILVLAGWAIASCDTLGVDEPGILPDDDDPGPDTDVPVAEVSVSPDSMSMVKGGSYQLSATIEPPDATDQGVTWSTSDPDTAVVSPSGIVTAMDVGEAIVTVTASDQTLSGECTITVTPVPVGSVTMSPVSPVLDVSTSAQMIASVLPESADNRSVTWESSNPDVASVTSSGLVTGHQLGDATITVTTADGGYQASTTVSIRNILEVTTLGPDGNEVAPHQIYAFDPVHKTYRVPDALAGSAYLFYYTVTKNVLVLAADPRYAGYVSESIPNTTKLNAAFTNDSGGSVIAEDGTCYVPGLEGRLNPIRDTLQRTYLYADNISIDSGQQQPVPFTPTQTMTLVDAFDVEKSITIPFIEGRTSLINYSD
jgi:hypothetical protein